MGKWDWFKFIIKWMLHVIWKNIYIHTVAYIFLIKNFCPETQNQTNRNVASDKT